MINDHVDHNIYAARVRCCCEHAKLRKRAESLVDERKILLCICT